MGGSSFIGSSSEWRSDRGETTSPRSKCNESLLYRQLCVRRDGDVLALGRGHLEVGGRDVGVGDLEALFGLNVDVLEDDIFDG